ncbi:myocardin-related transcription factor A-like isoform X1 [Brachyistius frenatus]|uniref:myocardin-related transcription factor A-like isoform X1 n=2 Tax=Brachyistius frenatus TaxID=100188 RepID=UPI0037E78A33
MLEHLQCVRIDPAPFGPQPISSNMDERAIRFELKRQACQSLRQVLKLKLQQRRTREELVSQGIMPPLKSSAAFHEQRRSLERARTEDYLKRKIRRRPERSELIKMHILEGTCLIVPPALSEEMSAESSLQAKQLQLKRARLADDLNDKIAHRPGPMELIHKNILPVHSSIKQVIIETQYTKASGENSSCDEDSNDSLSPGLPVSQECPLSLGPLPSPAETLAGSSIPSPTQVPPPAPPLPPISSSSTSLKLTNETVTSSVQRTGVNSHIKPKLNSDRSAQRHKKTKDNKPKIKKLKYHEYIPPDQKGDKEPPPHLDSSYAKILQQQQLFLQLQILSQQQQHYNYHTILPAPPKPETDQQPSSSSSSSNFIPTSSPPRPASLTIPSNQHKHSCLSSAPIGGTRLALPSNLDEMKVAGLKSELKLRSLPVSGTKNDLIERLRAYEEVSRGSNTTCSPTAGGTTGPGAEGAGRSSRPAAATTTTNNNNNNNKSQQQQFQCHQTSSLTADAGSSCVTSAVAAPQQVMTCGASVAPRAVSLTPSDCPSAHLSPEDASFNSDPSEELMSSPLTQLSLQPSLTTHLHTNIKEEPACSAPAPCQFSLQKHSSIPSAAPITTATVAVVTIDKDRLLQEKDKQIQELTMMLRQNQRLVEVLKMQLEHVNTGGRVPEHRILLKVKEEPPDKPSVALSTGNPLLLPHTTCASTIIDVTKVTVKQEAIEGEDDAPETTVQSPCTHGLLQPSTQTKQEHVCLQRSAQQRAIQKLLLQQQHSIQKQKVLIHNQMMDNKQNPQKLCQQRKKKSPKLLLRQQQQPKLPSLAQQQQSKHLQQMQLKHQILLKQRNSLIQQEVKLQVQKQPVQQQSPQVSPAYLNQQSGSAPSFPLDLLKSGSTPTLVTDGNGNHFLIALTNHITANQRPDISEGKATNHITLQRLHSSPAKLPGHNPAQLTRADDTTKQSSKTQNGALQVSVAQPQQEAAQCLSAPLSLLPFFKNQATTSSGKNTSSPSSQMKVCSTPDVLFSPLSPASIQTAASSPDDKDTEHEDDFIDIILQTGETSTTFIPAPDPSLDHLNSNFSAPSPPPSPLQLLLSPPSPPSCDTPHTPAPSVQPELQAPADTTKEKQHLGHAGGGRLEDFLESTTGTPLLGVEPGGLSTLIDDLHSQMLCTPSILDHPPSPMDSFYMATEGEQGLDSMDWLDLTMGAERDEETPTLEPPAPQTPPSVFSTDFLDSYDLHVHWDSCL